MCNRLKRVEAAVFERLWRRPPTGAVERTSCWLLVCSVALLLLRFVPGAVGHLSAVLAVLSLLALFIFVLVLAYRWLLQRVLWTVRNRLVVTCLLMGLAPVVLFGTLTGIAGYLLSGQFAINTARTALDEELETLSNEDALLTAPIGHAVELESNSTTVAIPALMQEALKSQRGLTVEAWHDGQRLDLRDTAGHPFREQGSRTATQAPLDQLPSWIQPSFGGIVIDQHRLYLRTLIGYSSHGRAVRVLASIPLTRESLSTIARGLGIVDLRSGYSLAPGQAPSKGSVEARRPVDAKRTDFLLARGGTLAGSANLFDPRVTFAAPMRLTDWDTGTEEPAMMGVVSRPTLLYARLFATSVRIGNIVRDALLAIAILFALVEAFAFYMAIRLSRTITQSIADLYGATTELDRGNFAHRIRVERRDQLAALATSFNTMAGSLQHLLEQQREKERIQSELEIAQEVQNNLFPDTPVHLPSLELHGLCIPARTMSGDYYDFIPAGEGQLCVALGDISGKGISAALLMASLHSAVRAYRLAGNEGAVALSSTEKLGHASPATLLALLNRHLFSSTQPEKYATLFFACYDAPKHTLTYSNGGQLPPFLLCSNGTLKRLDCGGSVVGLIDGLVYEQATISLERGDLLIAYSDGVTEPENDFGEFGEDRLLEVVRRYRDQPLAAISGEVMRALRNWIGNAEQPDDITLVLARQL